MFGTDVVIEAEIFARRCGQDAELGPVIVQGRAGEGICGTGGCEGLG
jgi:hypothetical protein